MVQYFTLAPVHSVVILLVKTQCSHNEAFCKLKIKNPLNYTMKFKSKCNEIASFTPYIPVKQYPKVFRT